MQKENSLNDEIDLRELGSAIWQGKWIILFVTTLISAVTVFYTLSLPNEYKSTVLLAPATSTGGSALSGLAGQYGGLASLAGINLGGSAAGEDKVAIALEIIKTWGFLEEFIKDNNMQVPLFAANGWNRTANKLIIDPAVYDASSKQWVRSYDPAKGQQAEPSSWELFKKFKDRVTFTQDKSNGLIRLSVEFYSPHLAKEWVEALVKSINANIKDRDRVEATKSIEYLKEKIQETQVADMQTVFYQLIEEQTKTLMLAEVSEEYVFKTLSPARVAEEKSKPRRALICILGFVLGGILSIFFVLVRYFFFTKDTNH